MTFSMILTGWLLGAESGRCLTFRNARWRISGKVGRVAITGWTEPSCNVSMALIKTKAVNRNRGMMLSLFKSLVWPLPEYCTAAWSPYYAKDRGLLERSNTSLPGRFHTGRTCLTNNDSGIWICDLWRTHELELIYLSVQDYSWDVVHENRSLLWTRSELSYKRPFLETGIEKMNYLLESSLKESSTYGSNWMNTLYICMHILCWSL